jgi:hypothetical protein
MNLNKNDNGLSSEEREKFATLSRQRQPLPALENRIISLLKSKGLILLTPSQRFFTTPRLAGAFAAIALVALGFSLGKWQRHTSQPDTGLQTFMMLLHESGRVDEHEADKVVEYGNWAQTIARANQLVAGEKLRYDGRLLRRVAGQLEVREFAPREDSDHLGGYFLIQARDYDEALKIAAGCPHLKYGGVVELRQIDKT